MITYVLGNGEDVLECHVFVWNLDFFWPNPDRLVLWNWILKWLGFAFSLCIIQEEDVRQPFTDSGCLLVDEDLFETGLEEEHNSALEDEESLESIRAAVKNKVKKHKASKRLSQ